jgi:hypothetical protein
LPPLESLTVVSKGADFTAAMAFQFASTNLVIDLGIIMTLILGWLLALTAIAAQSGLAS